jgi:penicillin amidase
MSKLRCSLVVLSSLLLALAANAAEIAIPGLARPVELAIDKDGVPHLFAADDFDLARAQGYLHARDRFFQMDVTRREVSGNLAELLGPGSLGNDIQLRTVGLRRAAERTLATLTPSQLALLQAYADGVNAWLATNPLPPEYAALELTRARSWVPVDSLVIGKGIAASLSLDIDVGADADLARFRAAGQTHGFDGDTLFFEDVRRVAPIDPVSTVPDATSGFPFLAAKALPRDAKRLASRAEGAARVRERFAGVPRLAEALERRETFVGSNEWGVAAEHSATGGPLIANDPHLGLDWPSTFYEIHLVAKNDPQAGPLNVSGVGFPGVPGVILGQNERVSWGATTNPMDVADVFQDELHVLQDCPEFDPPRIACILSGGEFHPVEVDLGVIFRANRLDGVLDNVGFGTTSPLITVPFRSFGPVIDVENPLVFAGGGVTAALTLQYTGFHATNEVQTFLTWNRAKNLDDFRAGLANFDFGSQNWVYTDVEGNLGYFASAELPLRADLEAGPVPRTRAPVFIRDGVSGLENWVPDPARSQGQAIPFAILPPGEMPQALNPPNGFFVNANNDPAGTSLDNDVLNQRRPGKPGAVYYLSSGYDEGLRAGRITRLIRDRIEQGRKISAHDMREFQLNDQQLDAELLVPHLLRAFENAEREGAPAELAALAAEPRIAEAVGRLANWDFSTPTGIPEGFDDSDVKGERRPSVPEPEARASVAATLYNLWRAKAIRLVIDARLTAFGLGVGAGDALKALHHLLGERPFDGVGASGVSFFPEPAGLASAADRRDVALLAALGAALDALASPQFAPAFAESNDQSSYRWGKLHRITFAHRFQPERSVPPAGGYDDLAPGMPGLARDGGYEVVNASSFSARADTLNAFRFSGGPVRRYVGESKRHAVRGWNAVPGGRSADPADPSFTVQLGPWLTGETHRVDLRTALPKGEITSGDRFVPAP